MASKYRSCYCQQSRPPSLETGQLVPLEIAMCQLFKDLLPFPDSLKYACEFNIVNSTFQTVSPRKVEKLVHGSPLDFGPHWNPGPQDSVHCFAPPEPPRVLQSFRESCLVVVPLWHLEDSFESQARDMVRGETQSLDFQFGGRKE